MSTARSLALAVALAACGGGDDLASPAPADAGTRDAVSTDAIVKPGEAGPDGNPCPSGRTLCGGACVDTTSEVANCGTCGMTCSIAAPSTVVCALGRCVATLATVPGQLGRVVVDATSAYAFNSASTSAVKVPIAGGPPTTILQGAAIDKLLAVDVASLYWFNSGDRRIYSALTDGTGPSALSTPIGSNLGPVAAIKVDATGIYYAIGEGVFRLQLRGGDPETLVKTTAEILGFDFDATAYYFTDAQGNVTRAPRDGSTPVKVAFGQTAAADIAVGSTDVYWSNGNGQVPGPLFKVALTGGMYVSLGTDASRLVVSDGSLYAFTSAGLAKLPLSETKFVTLSTSKTAVPDAIDATAIYWAESGNGVGKVMKLWPK
jgi:hypothetical protein